MSFCRVDSHFMMSVVFFFFKQKTAYEMRISDWSSDVCSSDLVALLGEFLLDRVIIGLRFRLRPLLFCMAAGQNAFQRVGLIFGIKFFNRGQDRKSVV